MPTIRLAADSDCQSVQACAEAAYHIYIERIGKPPAPMVADFKSLIAEQKVYVLELQSPNPLLLGFVVCFLADSDKRKTESTDNEHLYFLENIAVSPQVQGSGYGNRLIDYVMALATDCGCRTIELYTNELMTENIAWYKKLGFTEIDRVFEDGFNRVYMRLALPVEF